MKSLTAVLTEHQNGRTATELSAALADVVQSVQAHQRAGELVIKIKVKPLVSDKVVEPPLGVTIVHDVKAPRAAPPQAVFYPDVDGSLTRTPPERQPQLGHLSIATQEQNSK